MSTNDHDSHKKVHVRVVTTSGSYPEHGSEPLASTEIVQLILERTAKKLALTDTSTWVARSKDRILDPSKSYAENQLEGQVIIDYGPREGGGG